MGSLRPGAAAAAAIVTLALGACGSSLTGSGKPGGASARPTRAIAITATDQLRFSPAAVTVRPGETVAFSVTNIGALSHEFVIGDARFQAQHEQEMRSGGSNMHMGGEAGSIDVPPGRTVTAVYTFPQSGTLLFGCHVAGHYPGGMRGSITIG